MNDEKEKVDEETDQLNISEFTYKFEVIEVIYSNNINIQNNSKYYNYYLLIRKYI